MTNSSNPCRDPMFDTMMQQYKASRRGIFICIAGVDGSGKTEQAGRLHASLKAEGLPAIRTREPGGSQDSEFPSPSALIIRELLVNGETDRFSAMTEILLFAASRVENMRHLIVPALQAGRIVICDRFQESTLAYQGYGHGHSLEAISQIHEIACGGIQPDLTLWIKLDPAEALQRSKKRLAASGSGEDRFERLGLAFHQRVAEGFSEIAIRNPLSWIEIDGRGSQEDVHSRIYHAVGLYLRLAGYRSPA